MVEFATCVHAWCCLAVYTSSVMISSPRVEFVSSAISGSSPGPTKQIVSFFRCLRASESWITRHKYLRRETASTSFPQISKSLPPFTFSFAVRHIRQSQRNGRQGKSHHRRCFRLDWTIHCPGAPCKPGT